MIYFLFDQKKLHIVRVIQLVSRIASRCTISYVDFVNVNQLRDHIELEKLVEMMWCVVQSETYKRCIPVNYAGFFSNTLHNFR